MCIVRLLQLQMQHLTLLQSDCCQLWHFEIQQLDNAHQQVHQICYLMCYQLLVLGVYCQHPLGIRNASESQRLLVDRAYIQCLNVFHAEKPISLAMSMTVCASELNNTAVSVQETRA